MFSIHRSSYKCWRCRPKRVSPELGKLKSLIKEIHTASNERRQLSVFVSSSDVRSIWLRNDLENFKKRLIALEKQVAENGIILTDEQVGTLERKKYDDEAYGEI